MTDTKHGYEETILSQADIVFQIFIANKDRSSVRQNKMPLPVIASKIMLIPVKWHDNVGLRMEVYGCEPGKLTLESHDFLKVT